jgi:hypothetical protein
MTDMEQIEKAAAEAVRVIAASAENASHVIAMAAAEALKVANVQSSNDHDLLIKLGEKMEGLKSDIKDIKNDSACKIADHEIRVKKIENRMSALWIMVGIYTAVGATMIGLLLFHISK